MSHDYLGLFDTPPNRGENRLALAILGGQCLLFLAILPVGQVRVGPILAFLPMITAILFVGDLIIASLLYAQAEVFRSRALYFLATTYIFSALILVPYALTFPGAFAPNGLLHAGLNTTVWLMIFRQWTAPLSVITYILLKQDDAKRPPEVERKPLRVLAGIAAAAALVVALTLLTTVGHDLLPRMFISHSDADYWRLFAYNLSMVALLVPAIGMMLRRRSSVLDTWLLVSLVITLVNSLFNLPVVARFTMGWYCLVLALLFSHLFVLLALIAESNRLYVRLALATAERGREQDARLMSMDGVAAAISHEIGQPLAATSLSAVAALNALEKTPPNPERAIKSLRGAVEANQRAFAVLDSIRAMFGRKSKTLAAFDVNDLVRESASLLDREMAAQKIALRLVLDDTLPPVLANRVQIQRVLVNLLTNAIESISAAKSRERLIVIRSSACDHDNLRIEITDSGVGVTPEALARIFEPFFTTKSSGTGLGLSLSRTIVEDHGGRLWASPAEGGGATFSLELHPVPRATPAADERAAVSAL